MDTLVNRILELAQCMPDKLAVAFKDSRVTYAELAEKMTDMARGLYELGVQPGDKVCFMALSKPEMVATYLAIHYIGAVAVFEDKNGTPDNIAAICKLSSAKLLLCDKPLKEAGTGINVISLKALYEKEYDDKFSFAYRIPDEDEVAELLFTSGTTGVPKGVELTYKSVYNILSNTIEGIGIIEDDRLLLPLPLNHSFALRVLRATLYKGATLVLQNGFTFAKEVENNISAFKCTCMACVPASYEVMKSQMQDQFSRVLGTLRYIEFGAGSLSIKQRHEITGLLPGVTIYNTWGSSESGGAIFLNVNSVVNDENYVGALGRPLAGKVSVKVLNSAGEEIVSDEAHPGRMAIKGDMQMHGYWNNAEATAATLVDGWLLTGDMVYIKDGYIFMLGRADDIINVGGEKVSPIEVENIAGQYELIRECACIGAEDTDNITGQMVVLCVVGKAGFTEEGLAKYLSTKMERYKLPKKCLMLEKLPRNKMQKIDRKELRRLWENREDSDLLNPVMQAILARRSIRKFTDEDIPGPVLDMILKAGYHAPSGHNMQSWRFTVLTDGHDITKLKEAISEAVRETKINFYGFENPKVLILISNDSRNTNGCQDASCAAENIMLAAGSYSLGSVWLNPLVTLRDKEPVKSLLDSYGIPMNHIVWSTIALGYPVSDGVALAKNSEVVHYV